jgi:signal transduction histidine kinase
MTQGNRIRRGPGDKDPVLARIGHELRTPPNAIIGFTGTLLMRMPGPLNEDQDRQLRTVQSSARQLLSLINDLLDLLKIETGERELTREPTDCVAVLREVEEQLRPDAEQKESRLALSLPDVPVTIDTDRRTLKQLIANLIANAIRVTAGSSIRIGLRRLAAKDGFRAAFSIEDSGPGIGPEDCAGFFEPFARFDRGAPKSGTGLELYLSRKLAETLGGRVEVEGTPDGTRLTLELPG